MEVLSSLPIPTTVIPMVLTWANQANEEMKSYCTDVKADLQKQTRDIEEIKGKTKKFLGESTVQQLTTMLRNTI
jgi:hypothetical protein